jgi:hypothetical protein
MYPNANPKERGTYRSPKPPQKLKFNMWTTTHQLLRIMMWASQFKGNNLGSSGLAAIVFWSDIASKRSNAGSQGPYP